MAWWILAAFWVGFFVGLVCMSVMCMGSKMSEEERKREEKGGCKK